MTVAPTPVHTRFPIPQDSSNQSVGCVHPHTHVRTIGRRRRVGNPLWSYNAFVCFHSGHTHIHASSCPTFCSFSRLFGRSRPATSLPPQPLTNLRVLVCSCLCVWDFESVVIDELPSYRYSSGSRRRKPREYSCSFLLSCFRLN